MDRTMPVALYDRRTRRRYRRQEEATTLRVQSSVRAAIVGVLLTLDSARLEGAMLVLDMLAISGDADASDIVDTADAVGVRYAMTGPDKPS